MVSFKNHDRPSIVEIKEHPWLKLENKIKDETIKYNLIKKMKWKKQISVESDSDEI